MRIHRTACLFAVIAGIQGFAAAAAESSQPSAEDLVRAFRVCVRDTDGVRRLECYDKAMKRPADQPAPDQPAPDQPAPDRPAPDRPAPEQRFGLSPAQVLEKEHLAESPKEMTADVVAMTRQSQGPLVLTLANGQVWAEEAPDGTDLSIRIGSTVTVTREALGSFLLTSTASGHRSIRVKRLK